MIVMPTWTILGSRWIIVLSKYVYWPSVKSTLGLNCKMFVSTVWGLKKTRNKVKHIYFFDTRNQNRPQCARIDHVRLISRCFLWTLHHWYGHIFPCFIQIVYIIRYLIDWYFSGKCNCKHNIHKPTVELWCCVSVFTVCRRTRNSKRV